MGSLTISRKALSFLVLAALSSLACMSSCLPSSPDNTAAPDITTTPPEVTPGYTLFQGDTEGLMISFEYPESWVLEADDGHIYLHFGYQNSITLQYSSSASIGSISQSRSAPPHHFKDANELLEYNVASVSSLPSFQVISRGQYTLGGVVGEEATYSYVDILIISVDLGTTQRENIIYRHIVADYKDRIYSVRMRLDTDIDNFEDYNPDFEHLLATFRFLE